MSDSKKGPSIPSWQQTHNTEQESSVTDHPHSADPSTQLTRAELLEQAREFLQDESIKDASRERKTEFLKSKGLQSSEVEELLGNEHSAASEQHTEGLKTVHDSNQQDNDNVKMADAKPAESSTEKVPTPSVAPQRPQQPLQRDIPPIITYPEFLLKPQKPLPLITIPRLVNGAYVFAGLATITYSASKYIVEPLLENLTQARHSLASTTIADLETLNNKLESNVSHVPYIASIAARKSHDQDRDIADDDSITSDPTELFHRDIATQTTPSLSRTQSKDDSNTHLDATTHQAQRLSLLNDTLTSLVQALDPQEIPYLGPPASKKLRDTVSEFQTVLDKLETTYNPLRGDYYSTIYAQTADSKVKGSKDTDITAKVRADIRSLKGAFLSARNFPTAPRPGGSVNSYLTR